MFARLFFHFALLLLLLFTQLGSFVHSLSHLNGHLEQGKLFDYKCNLCDKYAQTETALETVPLLPLSLPLPESCPEAVATGVFSRHFVVFSARAPPGLA